MTIQPSLDLTPYLLESGDVQSYAWPGGYPIYFVTQDGGAMCPSCVTRNKKLINEAYANRDVQWNVVSSSVNHEDTDLYCCNCDANIESAYDDADTYEVIVGNVGSVYYGDNERDALSAFDTYVDISKAGDGHRAANEPVALIRNNDIAKEHVPDVATSDAE